MRLLLLALFFLRLLAPLADDRVESLAGAQPVWCAPDAAAHEPLHDPNTCALCQTLATHMPAAAKRFTLAIPIIIDVDFVSNEPVCSINRSRTQLPRAPPLNA